MGVIVDTSIWVNVERGRMTPREIAAAIDNDEVYLAPPVIAELEYGAGRARTAEERIRRESALARIKRKPCLIVDRDTGVLFGSIAAALDDVGRPSTHRVQDLWIAALAIQNGFRVLTENEHDFADVPGLVVVLFRR
jgi:predicted nucleic acid-binding protein